MKSYEQYLYIISGLSNSGKTTFGRHLANNNDFIHIEASTVYKAEVQKVRYMYSGEESSLLNWMHIQSGFDFVEKAGVFPFLGTTHKNLVYTGARTATGIFSLRTKAHFNNIKTILIWIDSDVETCYERAIKRNRNKISSLNEFKNVDTDECLCYYKQYGILLADYVIHNSNTIDQYFKQIDLIVTNFLKVDRQLNEQIKLALSDLDTKIIENNINYELIKEISLIRGLLLRKLQSK